MRWVIRLPKIVRHGHVYLGHKRLTGLEIPPVSFVPLEPPGDISGYVKCDFIDCASETFVYDNGHIQANCSDKNWNMDTRLGESSSQTAVTYDYSLSPEILAFNMYIVPKYVLLCGAEGGFSSCVIAFGDTFVDNSDYPVNTGVEIKAENIEDYDPSASVKIISIQDGTPTDVYTIYSWDSSNPPSTTADTIRIDFYKSGNVAFYVNDQPVATTTLSALPSVMVLYAKSELIDSWLKMTDLTGYCMEQASVTVPTCVSPKKEPTQYQLYYTIVSGYVDGYRNSFEEQVLNDVFTSDGYIIKIEYILNNAGLVNWGESENNYVLGINPGGSVRITAYRWENEWVEYGIGNSNIKIQAIGCSGDTVKLSAWYGSDEATMDGDWQEVSISTGMSSAGDILIEAPSTNTNPVFIDSIQSVIVY